MAHTSHPMTDGIKGANPDTGPKMVEGEHHYDKGYASDNSLTDAGDFPDNDHRGNAYMKMREQINSRDSAKLKRSKFSKIH